MSSAIPRVSLGTFQARGDDVKVAVDCAMTRAGIRSIDTASIYRNETEIGETINRCIRDGIVTRQDVFITSKVSPHEMGTKASAGVDGILDRLGVEFVDLLLVHWPAASKVPLGSEKNAVLRKETWRVLEDRLRLGHARRIGVSNFTVDHLAELLEYAVVKPSCNQVECHPLYPQVALRRFCAEHGVQVVAYSSFGAGALLGAGAFPEVHAIARERRCSAAQVLLRWGLEKGLCVIPKSVVPGRILEYGRGELEAGSDGRYLSEAQEQRLDGMASRYGQRKFCWDASGVR